MVDEFELNEAVSKLWPKIEKGKFIVWVGSGLSKNAGYPGWKETVRELCQKCNVTLLSESESESASKLIDKAEECKKANIDAYHDTLADHFGGPVIDTRIAYQLLMKLPFKAYITTNFDPLLSEAGAIEGYNNLYSYPILPPELGNPHPIFYVHGLARRNNQATGNNLILARSDFDEAYNNNIGIVNNFVVNIFTYYPLLFLGCSLTEPEMHEVFQNVHNIQTRIKKKYPSVTLPQNYIILPIQRQVRSRFPDEKIERDYTREQEEIHRFDKMEIEVIRYDPNEIHNHGEIENILRQLCTYHKRYSPPTPKMVFGEEELP